MTKRENLMNYTARSETFTYDHMQRLTSATVLSQPTYTISYAINGNISEKTNVGDYGYTTTRPGAISEINNPVNDVPTARQDITYNAFNAIKELTQENKKLTFTYGPDEMRKKMVYSDANGVTTTKYYSGNYERIEKPNYTKELTYINGADGLLGVYIKENSQPTEFYYILKDHQGSIVGLMTPTGTVVEEYAYDAWGKRRTPNLWCYDNTLTPSTYKIDRGYTGHEHLDEFGLINMNGRLYDPLLGRMLSPDNYIQAPNSSQSFNRFSYCLNNPLLYTDPSGEEYVTLYSLPRPRRQLGSGKDGREQFEIAEEWKRYIESAYTQYFLDDITSTGGLLPEAIVLAKSTTKKKPSRQIEFDDSWSKGLSAFDNIATISGLLVDGAQFGWNSMSNGQQWKYSYKASKYLKEKGKNVQPRVIKHGANGVLKNASRKITYVGGVIAVADIAIDGELRASHLLNVGMVGVSAIPVAGWIIGGSYFVADMITLGVTNQSIGQHIDNAVGKPIVNDIYNW